jgi:hypothetical protein
MNHYTITRPGKEEESSNKKEKEKIKEIDTTETLRAVETIKI